MSKLTDPFRWWIARGRAPQDFLGAPWIPAFLASVPNSTKRKWALRLLRWSPHYFFDRHDPSFRNMQIDEYLESAFAINVRSREQTCRVALKPHLEPGHEVLECGCGPGFLARALAPYVSKVYACDPSTGALACARVLNSAPNIEYLAADASGVADVGDGTVDMIVTLAVFQHLTDAKLNAFLQASSVQLKVHGKLACQVQLRDDAWRTEADWRADTSLRGRLRYRYGLHCFARTLSEYEELLARHGFSRITVESRTGGKSNAVPAHDAQPWLIARRTGGN